MPTIMPVESLEELDPPPPGAGVGAGVGMVGQLPWGIVLPSLSVAGHVEGTHSSSAPELGLVLPLM